jgi:aminoglycoside phosphotransferase (APT) family kinase protein
MPPAEVDVSVELVRQLLAEQHPDLAGLPLGVLANGWDNMVCTVGADLLARLPRRAPAAELVAHEQRWLPVLAPRLPLPIPAPVRVGRPAGRFPWRWSVVPFLPGQVAALAPPGDLASAAVALGEFLAVCSTASGRLAGSRQGRGAVRERWSTQAPPRFGPPVHPSARAS